MDYTTKGDRMRVTKFSSKLALSLLTAAMWIICGCGIAAAQVSSAAISGRVEDPSGAAIPGAMVTVTSMETGAVRTITADDSGNYRVVSLPVGLYEVRAEKTGFKAEIQTGVNLVVGQQAVLNLQLEVGAVSEQVTVTGEAPLVNTTTASVAGLVGEQQVKDLPLNGRSFDMLITLNPGTFNYSAVARNQGSSGTGTNMFSVAGRRPSENVFLLNGVEYTGTSNVVFTPGGASGQMLGIDAVREFNVVGDTYGAEYGKRSGAQISVVTQSGSNQLHGSLFEFLRNSKLDARNFYDHGNIAPFKRNQFGGAAGGPILKDKAFVFGNYEGFRQRLGLSSLSFVPDLNARKGLLPPANDPFGTATPVPNLDSRMLPYLNDFWPLPNGRNLGQGIAESFSNPAQSIRQDFGTIRFDQAVTGKDNLSETYTIDDGNNLTPTIADPVFGSTTLVRNQVAGLQETHVFSPEIINSLSAGFSRANFQTLSAPLVPIPANLFFVPGTASPGAIVIGAIGAFTSQGLSSAGSHTSYRIYRRSLFSANDGVQVLRGKHQFSFGGWFQRIQENDADGLRGSAQASFASIAGLLQGQITNLQVTPKVANLGWRSWEGAWYAQDSIQLKPNLTVRLGLRHEFSNGWNEVNGNAQTYQFINGVIQTIPVLSSHFGTGNNAKWLFSPRLGIAWDPFGKGKTSIRASVGTYYDMVDALSYLADTTPPLSGAASYSPQSLFSVIPVNTSFQPPPCTGGPNVPNPCNIYAPKSVEPNFKTPTLNSWNFSVEQQLNKDTALRLAYVGFQGYHQFVTVDPNTIPSQICSNPSGCVAGGVNAARTTVSQGTEYVPVGTRPNFNLTSGIYLMTEGNSSYNALQADVTRRLTKGMQFRVNYTWSKSMDISSGIIGNIHSNETQTPLNPYKLSLDHGPSGMDIRHQFSSNISYELPIGQGKAWLGGVHGAADKLISGWQVNSIVTLLSGFNLTPFIGSNSSGNGDTNAPDRPNYAVGFNSQNAIKGSPIQWFNPAAFTVPASGTFGNLGRGILRGPGLRNWDFSLFKNTLITERIRLQFRAEAFNILNHTNFGAPTLSLFTGTTFSPSAGVIANTTTSSRQVQFGMKLIF